MKRHIGDDEPALIRQYLLNRLPEDLRHKVEDRLMTDNLFSEQLKMAEGELCDEYVAGRLWGTERESFQALFLAQPELRRQVDFARALHQYVESNSAAEGGARHREGSWKALAGFLAARSFGFRAVVAAACLAIVLGGSWLLLTLNRLQNDIDSLQSQQAKASNERLGLAEELRAEKDRRIRAEQELASQKAKGSPGTPGGAPANFLAIMLQPGLVREAGNVPQILLPPNKDGARFELSLENDVSSPYEAVLETPEGAQVWRASGLASQQTPRGPAVFVQLSRQVLKPQDYILRLTAVAADGTRRRAGTYYFRITSR